MKAIYLHGILKDKFGEVHHLEVKDPSEAVRALCYTLPGFEQIIINDNWKVVKGGLDNGVDLDESALTVAFGRIEELHIIPELVLGKKAGIGKMILGIAMVAAAFALPAFAIGAGMAGATVANTSLIVAGIAIKASTIALFGASMALGGLSQMLAPVPKTGNYGDREDNKPSFLFQGGVQLYEQGNPVPLAYGLEVRTGSVVVAAATFVYDIATDNGEGTGYPEGVIKGIVNMIQGTQGPANENNQGVTLTPSSEYSYDNPFTNPLSYTALA